MFKYLSLSLIILLLMITHVFAVHIEGYYKADGTYVRPHEIIDFRIANKENLLILRQDYLKNKRSIPVGLIWRERTIYNTVRN